MVCQMDLWIVDTATLAVTTNKLVQNFTMPTGSVIKLVQKTGKNSLWSYQYNNVQESI